MGLSGAPASSPPVHDSATPMRCPPRSSATCVSIVSPSVLKTCDRWRSTSSSLSVCASSSSPGRLRMSITSSARRRQVVISSGERSVSVLDLAQALCDLGLGDPEHADLVEPIRRRALSSSCTGSVSSACGHIACSSRGGPGMTTIAIPSPGTTRPGAVPAGSTVIAPSGTIACFRFATFSASGSMRKRRAKPAQDLGDPLLHALVEDQLAARERPHDLGGEVVGGRPQPAGGDDQLEALVGEEAQGREQVLAAVADGEDVGDLDSQPLELLRDPGAVAVAHAARQHLGPGDDDAAARGEAPSPALTGTPGRRRGPAGAARSASRRRSRASRTSPRSPRGRR